MRAENRLGAAHIVRFVCHFDDGTIERIETGGGGEIWEAVQRLVERRSGTAVFSLHTVHTAESVIYKFLLADGRGVVATLTPEQM
jgi:hypothetical protein